MRTLIYLHDRREFSEAIRKLNLLERNDVRLNLSNIYGITLFLMKTVPLPMLDLNFKPEYFSVFFFSNEGKRFQAAINLANLKNTLSLHPDHTRLLIYGDEKILRLYFINELGESVKTELRLFEQGDRWGISCCHFGASHFDGHTVPGPKECHSNFTQSSYLYQRGGCKSPNSCVNRREGVSCFRT